MKEVIIISNIRREELRLRTFSWSQIPPASNTKTPGCLLSMYYCVSPPVSPVYLLTNHDIF